MEAHVAYDKTPCQAECLNYKDFIMKLGFFSLLTIVFVTLKLTHVIGWSWWLVVSPMLIGGFLVFFILLVAAIHEVYGSR
jgi:hypothetical protein